MRRAVLFSIVFVIGLLMTMFSTTIPSTQSVCNKPLDVSNIQYAARPIETDKKPAQKLDSKIRIVCWINTWRMNLDTKAKSINDTWGRRCNQLIFVSDHENDSFPTIGFNTTEGKIHMVPRIFKAFDYIYEHHLNDGDWFLRSDDDAYVIMENLRHSLTSYNPTQKWYLGSTYIFGTSQGFNSGRATIVLSKKALDTFYHRPANSCRNEKITRGADDLELGRCLLELGVKPSNTRDKLNRTRFHPYRPIDHILGSHCTVRGHQRMKYGCKEGMDSISEGAISFHHLNPDLIYTIELLLYRIQPYGIGNSNDLNS